MTTPRTAILAAVNERHAQIMKFIRGAAQTGAPIMKRADMALKIGCAEGAVELSFNRLRGQGLISVERSGRSNFRVHLLKEDLRTGWSEGEPDGATVWFARSAATVNRANQMSGISNLKERDCLRCRSKGIRTMVLGGPGHRLCDPCLAVARGISMGEGCYSAVPQFQSSAA